MSAQVKKIASGFKEVGGYLSALSWVFWLACAVCGAAVTGLGYLEGVPWTYRIVASMIAVAAAMWLWNLVAWRRNQWVSTPQPIKPRIPGIELTPSDPPLATLEEMASSTITKRTIRLVDMIDVSGNVANKYFEDCLVLGPAMVGMRQCEFLAGRFEASPGHQLYFEAIPGRILCGVTFLDHCIFRRCVFVRVGFCIPKDMIAKLQQHSTESTINSQE